MLKCSQWYKNENVGGYLMQNSESFSLIYERLAVKLVQGFPSATQLLWNFSIVFVWMNFNNFATFQLRPYHESVHRTLDVIGSVFLCLKSKHNFFYISQKNLQLMSRIFFDENLLFMALTSWKESAFLQVKTKRSEYNGRPALNIIGSWSAIFCNKKGVAWNKIYEWEYW